MELGFASRPEPSHPSCHRCCEVEHLPWTGLARGWAGNRPASGRKAGGARPSQDQCGDSWTPVSAAGKSLPSSGNILCTKTSLETSVGSRRRPGLGFVPPAPSRSSGPVIWERHPRSTSETLRLQEGARGGTFLYLPALPFERRGEYAGKTRSSPREQRGLERNTERRVLPARGPQAPIRGEGRAPVGSDSLGATRGGPSLSREEIC